ncbi:DUF1510 family protein [Bacillus paralicheniformis]|nr:DUF1510 family protein [Bacillus paralicheniformis]MEC1232875.1 DUF1510 family protein [Bacillus paralicheniformis]
MWHGHTASPHDAKATMPAKDPGVKTRVPITWFDGNGWKPTKVHQLK